MDKAEFLSTSPEYAALAIAGSFETRRKLPSSSISAAYGRDLGAHHWNLYNGLLEAGLRRLITAGALDVIAGPFEPNLYERSDAFDAVWSSYVEDPRSPFHRYNRIVNPQQAEPWLRAALQAISGEAGRLKISEDDWSDVAPDQWEPLPLDRDQPLLRSAMDAVDTAINDIRSDNGYAATAPDEREYVLEGLTPFQQRLRTASSIAMPFIQTAIDRLAIVVRRLGESAVGESAKAARAAIFEWVKDQAAHLLSYLNPWS